jgi:hypothetical protein
VCVCVCAVVVCYLHQIVVKGHTGKLKSLQHHDLIIITSFINSWIVWLRDFRSWFSLHQFTWASALLSQVSNFIENSFDLWFLKIIWRGMFYVCWHFLFFAWTVNQDEAVEKVVEFMNVYSISQEDMDTIVELSKFQVALFCIHHWCFLYFHTQIILLSLCVLGAWESIGRHTINCQSSSDKSI